MSLFVVEDMTEATFPEMSGEADVLLVAPSAVEAVRLGVPSASIAVLSPDDDLVLVTDGTIAVAARVIDDVVRLSAEDRPVWVRPSALADDDSEAAELAAASVAAWVGATYFVTNRVEPLRRALDMTATIKGLRAPAAVRRGLA